VRCVQSLADHHGDNTNRQSSINESLVQ
jgi:hypothetical protein